MSSGPSGARHTMANLGKGRDLKFKVKGNATVALFEAIKKTKAEFPEYSQFKTAQNQPAFEIELVDHWRKNGYHHFHYHGSWVMFIGE